jgi:hypothetical protein
MESSGRISRAEAAARLIKKAERLRDAIVSLHSKDEIPWDGLTYIALLERYREHLVLIALLDRERIVDLARRCCQAINDLDQLHNLLAKAGEKLDWPEHLQSKVWEIGLRHRRLHDQLDICQKVLELTEDRVPVGAER